MSFTIRELESLSGVKAHTIRIWEQRYGFLKPSRTSTNIRTYSNEELKTLLTVALLNKYGFRISRIDQMNHGQREEAILNISDQEARDESLVNEMIGYMIDMKSLDFERLLETQIRKEGIQKTITALIFQFLEKVGLLWQTNRIIPVQEHLVSNIIRQKLVTAIDGLSHEPRLNSRFLLFLPEDEHHEMGLLYVYYLLRLRGADILYLGANVPLKDVEHLIHVKKPDYLYIHLTSFPRKHNFARFLTQLSQKAEAASILISGAAEPAAAAFPRITFFQSLEAVATYIEEVK